MREPGTGTGDLRALDRELSLMAWFHRRSFEGSVYGLDDLRRRKRESVSVILPARNVAATIGGVLDEVMPLLDSGLLDEVLVVDAASEDGTAEVARSRGARVEQEAELMPGHGPPLGKGDAMWRGLTATRGEIVLYLDTDTEDFHSRFVLGLLGPLFCDAALAFVKGAFTRPFKAGDAVVPDGGGRVTELVARPLLNLFVPDLAGFVQPLAGEIGARRRVLEAIPFPVGYGIETGMLIDVLRLVGLDAMGQVDLGTRQNRHQSLRELTPMAYSVLVTALVRVLGPDAVAEFGPGHLAMPLPGATEMRAVALEERPPLVSLRVGEPDQV